MTSNSEKERVEGSEGGVIERTSRSKIKLLIVDTMQNGTIRLQSQLMVGRDSVDFIMKDGVLKCYTHGKRGFGFYEYEDPYEIVENRKDMIMQEL